MMLVCQLFFVRSGKDCGLQRGFTVIHCLDGELVEEFEYGAQVFEIHKTSASSHILRSDASPPELLTDRAFLQRFFTVIIFYLTLGGSPIEIFTMTILYLILGGFL